MDDQGINSSFVLVFLSALIFIKSTTCKLVNVFCILLNYSNIMFPRYPSVFLHIRYTICLFAAQPTSILLNHGLREYQYDGFNYKATEQAHGHFRPICAQQAMNDTQKQNMNTWRLSTNSKG